MDDKRKRKRSFLSLALQSFSRRERELSGARKRFESFCHLQIFFDRDLICRDAAESRRRQIKPQARFDKRLFRFEPGIRDFPIGI